MEPLVRIRLVALVLPNRAAPAGVFKTQAAALDANLLATIAEGRVLEELVAGQHTVAAI